MVEQDGTRHRVSGAPQKATKGTSRRDQATQRASGRGRRSRRSLLPRQIELRGPLPGREPAPMRSLTYSPAAFCHLSPGVLPSRRVETCRVSRQKAG